MFTAQWRGVMSGMTTCSRDPSGIVASTNGVEAQIDVRDHRVVRVVERDQLVRDPLRRVGLGHRARLASRTRPHHGD